ncbi:hypothetical protein A9Q84_00735 [Halobacteriovorax marinus]|uniref:Uncharacterized protein n=1 Tax=Halobacteriovorax marinus TaxID=97084 RepID=A0A1Y5FBX5_9BACT|nr:hypothetical protein A9Q84_00735 [Halobacteriovorax marinus]
MKVDTKVSPTIAKLQRENNSLGSVGAKTKIVVEADEKVARESLAHLSKPSKALKIFASALRKLNSF